MNKCNINSVTMSFLSFCTVCSHLFLSDRVIDRSTDRLSSTYLTIIDLNANKNCAVFKREKHYDYEFDYGLQLASGCTAR